MSSYRGGSRRNRSSLSASPYPSTSKSPLASFNLDSLEAPSIPSRVNQQLPANFTSLRLFDQLQAAFPDFSIEAIRREAGGRYDTSALEDMFKQIESSNNLKPCLVHGIPPAIDDKHDIFYTAIPSSRLSIRFYPGGTWAPTEGMYCMDVYDPATRCAVAVPPKFSFFQQDGSPGNSEALRIRIQTLESTFNQPPTIPGKFTMKENTHCLLARPHMPDFHFAAPIRRDPLVTYPTPA
ncbi:hypothetical protein C8R46DRAFT_1102391 [Mycena filopes]|nr:hypothetical protein C8R46DRAFT_1102391 [Mycena filopes]